VLIAAVREVARAAPEQAALITNDRALTYAELAAWAEALAGGLRARGLDRFGITVSDWTDAAGLLVASSLLGAEACIYPGSTLTDGEERAALAARLEHRAVLTDADVGGLAADGAAAPAAGAEPPADGSVMILTTGTTGPPKGARHEWARLLSGVRRGVRPGSRWLLAYNLNQFAGMQVLLHSIANAGALVLPPTNRPRDALAAMRTHGVTHASATPTFWRFLTALLDDGAPVPALEQITLGGEAIPPGLVEELGRWFPDAKVSQVYASTEFGSAVSVRDDRIGLPIEVLDRGDDADVQFKIVDGELHARSRVGMVGYHGDATGADPDGWRPTGDVVEVVGDRILFAGRTTEVINVGGVKVHPLRVEEVVAPVPGVELVRASGRKNALTGQIVTLEVVAKPGFDEDDLEDAIRAACQVLPDAARPRRVKFVESLAVVEHKISRRTEGGT
jgi:acyl-coenzyme A synthetase/AMP-(fatty) acid ligase